MVSRPYDLAWWWMQTATLAVVGRLSRSERTRLVLPVPVRPGVRDR